MTAKHNPISDKNARRFRWKLKRIMLGISWLALVLALGWEWSVDRRHSDPFFEQGWFKWFFAPQPDLSHRSMLVVPAGSSHDFIPRDLARVWRSTPNKPLQLKASGPLEFRPPDQEKSVLVQRVALKDGSPHLGLIGSDGVLRLGTTALDRCEPAELPLLSRQDLIEQLGGLKHHEDAVYSTAFSPDGKILASASADDTVILWDAEQRKPIGDPLKGHESPVLTVVFSPAGKMLASADEDGTVILWDVDQRKPMGESLKGHQSPLLNLAFSPDGKNLLSISRDGAVYIWDLNSGKNVLRMAENQKQVPTVSVSPNGRFLAMAEYDGTIQVLDLSAYKVTVKFAGHKGLVTSLQFSPDGKALASASSDYSIRLWDAATGGELMALPTRLASISGISFSPDGKTLAVQSEENEVWLWDTAIGKPDSILKGHSAAVTKLVFSPDGRILACGSLDQSVWLWNVADRKKPRNIGPKGSGAVDFDFSPDGSSLAIAGSDGSVRLWRISPGDKAVPRGLALTGSGEIWVVGERGFAARSLGNILSWKEIALPVDSDLFAVFPADGEKTWVAGADGAIWFTEDGGTNWTNQTIEGGKTIRALAFLDDAKSGWAVGDGGAVYHTRNGQTWQMLTTLSDAQPKSIHVQSNGLGWIAAEADGGRRVYQANQAGDPQSWRLLQQDRLPAPWWFIAGFPAFLLLSFLNVRAWVQAPRPPPASIAGQALSDRPIGWRDPDPLNFRPIALGLSRFIRNINTEPPLTLAVTGRWGSGKSSLMNLLQHDLRRYGACPVWFNAWHHRKEEHLLAALLENIRSQAIPPWWSWPGVAFRARLFWLRTRKQFAWILATGTFSVVFVYVIHLALPDMNYQVLAGHFEKLVSFFDGLPQEVKTGLGWGKFGIAGVAATFWLRSKFIALTVDPAKLIGQLSTRTRIRDFRDKLGFRFRFGKEFGEVCRALRTRRTPGLTILIDDLDRCRPRDVLEVLEAVNFFVSVGSCFVILGMDKGQVEHCIGLGFKDVVASLPDEHFERTYGVKPKSDSEKQYLYAKNYLEKLINIEAPIPNLDSDRAGALLRGDSGSLPEPSKWAVQLKAALVSLFQVTRVSVIIVCLALLAVWLIQTRLDTANGRALSSVLTAKTDQHSKASASKTAPPSGSTGDAPARSAVSKQNTTVEINTVQSSENQSQKVSIKGAGAARVGTLEPNQLRDYWHWAWWGPLALCFLIFTFWGIGAALRQVRGVVQDSPEFKQALEIVLPLLYATNPTPRSIKRYQNRMRYLATRLRPVAYEPDPLDHMLRRFGQKLSVKLVPEAWFTPKSAPRLPEQTLLMLGALESIDPDYIRIIYENDGQASNLMPPDKYAIPDDIVQLIRSTANQMRNDFPKEWPPNKNELAQYLELSHQSSQLEADSPQNLHIAPSNDKVSPSQLKYLKGAAR